MFVWQNMGARTHLHRCPHSSNKGEDLIPTVAGILPRLILSQYIEDCPQRNRQWARIARVFTAREISGAQLKLLRALDWDLSITDDEVMTSWISVVQYT